MHHDTRSAMSILAAQDRLDAQEAALAAQVEDHSDDHKTGTDLLGDVLVTPAELDRTPVADGPDDDPMPVQTITVPLDGGTAVVEHVDGRAEVTIRLGERLAAALILSPAEADALGMALARPGGFTVSDYFTIQDLMGRGQA